MKIRFIKSPSGEPYKMGYFIGDEAEIEDAVARDLLDQGMAVPVVQPQAASAEKATSKAAEKAEKR